MSLGLGGNLILWIQEQFDCRSSRIRGVSSVLPSSTIIHKSGFNSCPITAFETSGRFSSSFFAGVTSRYFPFNSAPICPPPVDFFSACHPCPFFGAVLKHLLIQLHPTLSKIATEREIMPQQGNNTIETCCSINQTFCAFPGLLKRF